MSFDKFDNRYKYYIYPTKDVESCIENGIQITSGGQLDEEVKSINKYLYNGELNDYIKNNYKDADNLIIVRIPLYYFGWIHRNGVRESFVPILKSFTDKETSLTETYLIPELIYGVYNKKNNEYIKNDKYNLFYDPNGLHFCAEQIQCMFEYGCYDIYQNAFFRQRFDYDELREYDIDRRIWNKTVNYYKSSKLKKKILNINKNRLGRR